MSRSVNWDEPTEPDLRWAVEWEQWRQLEQAGFDVNDVRERFGLEPHSDGGKFFNTAGVPGDDYPKRVNPKTGLVETVFPDGHSELFVAEVAEEDDDDDEDEELPPYDEWKVPDLKQELVNRGLSDSGKKDELVRRLIIDDVARERAAEQAEEPQAAG